MEKQRDPQMEPEQNPNVEPPVPAWQHYNIVKYAQAEVMRELEKNAEGRDSEDFLTGLAVSYIHIPEEGAGGERYSISFGYDVDVTKEAEAEDTGEPLEESPHPDALDEAFIDQLYEKVQDKLLASVSTNDGEYLVSLEITTGHCSTIILTCYGRRCWVCGAHRRKHTQRRRQTISGCRWVCTGTNC
ncbi:MAG TPA: hypothetical protein VJ821_12395 [Anaerolineales bacterium]|nr:hypothetical protein [Anaerolineales bacterium]